MVTCISCNVFVLRSIRLLGKLLILFFVESCIKAGAIQHLRNALLDNFVPPPSPFFDGCNAFYRYFNYAM